MINIPQNFYRETIAQDLAVGTGNVYVSAIPTVSQGYLTISPSSSILREIIFFTSSGTDSTGPYVVVSSAGHRGMGGTTEQTHIIGEPVRMNVGAETIQEISDDIDAIVAAGAPAATTTTTGLVYLPVIETTTGTTHSLTTVANEKVIVWAKGNVSYTAAGAQNGDVLLNYNGVQKDIVRPYAENITSNKAFALMYTETPGAGTQDITVTSTLGGLGNVVIIVLKIRTP